MLSLHACWRGRTCVVRRVRPQLALHECGRAPCPRACTGACALHTCGHCHACDGCGTNKQSKAKARPGGGRRDEDDARSQGPAGRPRAVKQVGRHDRDSAAVPCLALAPSIGRPLQPICRAPRHVPHPCYCSGPWQPAGLNSLVCVCVILQGRRTVSRISVVRAR